jgi:hypothetical protein
MLTRIRNGLSASSQGGRAGIAVEADIADPPG